MVRQPYSVAVRAPSRAVFLFFPEGRRPRREVEPSLMVKKDGMILEQISFQERRRGKKSLCKRDRGVETPFIISNSY